MLQVKNDMLKCSLTKINSIPIIIPAELGLGGPGLEILVEVGAVGIGEVGLGPPVPPALLLALHGPAEPTPAPSSSPAPLMTHLCG